MMSQIMHDQKLLLALFLIDVLIFCWAGYELRNNVRSPIVQRSAYVA